MYDLVQERQCCVFSMRTYLWIHGLFRNTVLTYLLNPLFAELEVQCESIGLGFHLTESNPAFMVMNQ